MKWRYRNITIISVHAPTEEKEEKEKEDFYESSEETYQKIQYYLVIIMGDCNAKMGREEYQKKRQENTQYVILVPKMGTY
jgi:exonuclease III